MKTLTEGTRASKADVTRALYALHGHNVFQHQTLWSNTNGVFDHLAAVAAKNMKWWLGYAEADCKPSYGDLLDSYLYGRQRLSLVMRARRAARGYESKYVYPLKARGVLLGIPGVGTHSWIDPPNNWQSDNAVDLGCPYGTPVVAVETGIIGNLIGPLTATAAHNEDGETHSWTDGEQMPLGSDRFAGLRVYVETASDAWYYAHNSRLVVKAGQHVVRGQVIAYTGEANNVNHLHIARKNGDPRVLLKAPLV